VESLKRYQKKSQDYTVHLFDSSENIKETLHDLLKQAVIESLEDRITKGCFMVNTSVELAMHDPEIAKIVQNNTKVMEEVFTNAVQKGQDLGQISKKNDARVLARFIFNNYSGIRVLARSGEKDKQVYDDIIKAVLSIL
jgi:TetR/AcrR family transcriptional repressor of nem operon